MVPLHRVERANGEIPAEDANAILGVDRVGCEEAWGGGAYHMPKRGPIASPLIFMATLIGGGATSC